MEYRRNQEFSFSEIGIGCYALSGVYGTKDHNVYIRMLQRAYELGINFFDTADTYGDTAEEILGAAIRPFRGDVFIATKVGIRDRGQPNLSASYVRQACENSLKRMQTDIIDLYQIHFDDPNTPVEETVNALEGLVSEGKIRRYGLGHLPLDVMKEYTEVGNPFSVLMELSAAAREAREAILPFCREVGLAAIAFSITGRGILTGKIRPDVTFEAGDIRILDPLFQRERFESALRITDEFKLIGLGYKKTPGQVAINWVLAQPGIMCALCGPSTIAHLEENIGGSGWQLDQNNLKRIERLFERENRWLVREQGKILRQLLQKKLNPDPMQAFTDLIYMIETSVLLKFVEESTLLPTFIELFGLRDSIDAQTMGNLQRIHQSLRDQIQISID
jgi:aryl-alcohol dehydrogenase-like predicted oxidoreductase